MEKEFIGKTELTTKELKQYSKGASWLERLLINLLLLAAIGLFYWFAIVPIMERSEFFSEGASEIFGVLEMDAPSGSLFVIQARVALAMVLSMFVLIHMIHRLILIPIAKNIFNKTREGYANVTNAHAGSVEYKIDRFGLEYNIQSADAEERYKQYWRNFTEAEYSPDTIQLFKGRKQTAFILMRAFAGREREVGQFVEFTMNKIIEK